MGYLEDLGRQKEAERRTEEECDLRRKTEKENEEARAKILIQSTLRENEARHNKAKKYYDESKIYDLLKKLNKIDGNVDLKDQYKDYCGDGISGNLYAWGKIGVSKKVGVESPWGYENYFEIIVLSDGSITFEGDPKNGTSIVPEDAWKKDRNLLEEKLVNAYKHPQIHERYSGYNSTDGGPCLHTGSIINTSKGLISVKELRIGDIVWTVDRIGRKMQSPVIRMIRLLAANNHKMAHIALVDGRKLIVSPGHPTIDNKELGSLRKGQVLDGSRITSIEILPYKEKYTYDILPSGETGGYWANGILIGSTLSPQFKNMQEKKLNKQIPWYLRLFA